jgi:PPP family 3-phenylpropionic acid transporter
MTLSGAIQEERWRAAGWRVSLGYLWSLAAVGAYTPFAAIYFLDLGFSGVQVGVLAALPALGIALAGPLWGAAADAMSLHRGMLAAALLLATLLALAASRVTAFLPLLLLLGLLALIMAPVAAILDAYAVTIAERFGGSYGGLRVWGSVGYTAAALGVGQLMGERVTSLFLVIQALCLGLGLLAIWGLPGLRERAASPLFGGLGALLRNRPFVVLLLIGYLTASGAAIMNSFLGIRMQELGGAASLVGLAIALGAASEFPVVARGGWFLTTIGAPRLVTLAVAVYALRFLAYATIPSAAWMLPVQLLHGLSFGAFLIASVTLTYRLAGPRHAAAAQALLAATSFGLGSITGSLVGGALLDEVGTAGLFRGAALLMLLPLVISWGMPRLLMESNQR